MIDRDRGIVILPLHGGFLIEWNEQFEVQTPKMKSLQTPGPEYYGKSDMPMPAEKMSVSKAEVVKEVQQHRTAVRESLDGTLKLVSEILSRKTALLSKEMDVAEGGVSLGEGKTGVAGNAVKT